MFSWPAPHVLRPGVGMRSDRIPPEVQLQYVGLVRVDEFLVREVFAATKWLLKATGTPRGLVSGRLFIAHCKLLRIWNRRPKPVIGG